MCILSPATPDTTPATGTPSAARLLSPDQRQQLAVTVLAGTQPIAQLADAHDVSRKFVYQQADKAQHALDQAFSPPLPDDQQVLFTIPVTKALLRQIVLGLVLICHSSFRGVVEFLKDLFDFPLSLGSVANIVQAAVAPARAINEAPTLSAIAVGAHDEIYQGRQPVLVGVCAHSRYCYLLAQEPHRDAATWQRHLLDLKERDFRPDATIGDFAGGLRAGQKLALPEVPCRGDVFHALYECGKGVRHLESLAYQALSVRLILEQQLRTPGKRRDRLKGSLRQRLRYARVAEAQAIARYDAVAVLVSWLRDDILSVTGPALTIRRALYDFVVAELQAWESSGPKKLGEIRKLLQNQREELLAFVGDLEKTLAAVAAGWHVSEAVVKEVFEVQLLPPDRPDRPRREAALRQPLRGRYHGLSRVVAAVARRVVRASSVAENLNSRLRGYFFLRRELGAGYLSLLQFYLNHRRLPRSKHAERVGKSPAELLTGQSQPHWLEQLGYQRFQRN